MTAEALWQDKEDQQPDPNRVQARAANPGQSVWVGASAGTGKTKVLTDRLLRLMLPSLYEGSAISAGGSQTALMDGTAPHRILCLTFTKIGAAEMKERLSRTLRDWSLMIPEDLEKELENLLGHMPHPDQLAKAQSLFAQVVDTPGGLKIMTIHSFCQSVLARFPLEAGISPHGMQAIEETDHQRLLKQAFRSVLKIFAGQDQDNFLTHLLLHQKEEDLLKLAQNILSERQGFTDMLARYGGVESIERAIFETLNLSQDVNEQDLLQQFKSVVSQTDLYTLIDLCMQGALKMQNMGVKIKDALESDFDFTKWRNAFLNDTGQPRALYKPVKQDEQCASIFAEYAERLATLEDQIKALKTAQLTSDMLLFGLAILKAYKAEKESENALDFDDLIYKTAALLEDDSVHWVMYKLDGGIDHILVDEAQDTNPDQWLIIRRLCEEFFSGMSTRDPASRTLFVVGDEKQSIFSFQRADPVEFFRMQRYFSEQISRAQLKFEAVPMQVSFRTVQGILDLVDQVFADWKTRHYSHRKDQAAHIELWPLFESQGQAKQESWTPPIQLIDQQKAGPVLAGEIAKTIRLWLDEERILPSRARPVRPGDILILMPSRTAFVQNLLQAFKRYNIPVSGSDRLIVRDDLAVMDILAAMRFALQPEDDLTLACLLKSPFINMGEEALFALCYDRGDQPLYNRIEDPDLKDWLQNLIIAARSLSAFDFLNHLLFKRCLTDPVSGMRALTQRLGSDCLDPVEECLTMALNFEQEEIASPERFIRYMDGQSKALKREMESTSNAVRIMTAHGAKGLQAPIVFMPDTTRYSKQARGNMDALLWPKDTGLAVPLFSPYKDVQPQFYKAQKEQLGMKQDEEYLRLLYVAMTRAEDELYICGIKKHANYLAWYDQILSAMKEMGEVREEEFQTPDEVTIAAPVKYILSRPQQAGPDKSDKKGDSQEIVSRPIPDWLANPMPDEPDPPTPLTPSRPSGDQPAALSPLAGDSAHRFLRGNLTHKLLQILPDLSPDLRENRAVSWLDQNGKELEASVRRDIAREVMAILNHPNYAPLFGPGSLAEAPISGLIGKKQILSGQIDRLVILQDEIKIIDYKSNRPSPDDPADVPAAYIKQMQSYAAALAVIYPDHKISAYLLWTDGPHIMQVI